MKKLTKDQLFSIIQKHNKERNVRGQFEDFKALVCVIVFKKENWPDKNYSLKSRSYSFRSDNKCFVPCMGGYSCFAGSLDGSDAGIRLEQYWGKWSVDYCYIENEEDI